VVSPTFDEELLVPLLLVEFQVDDPVVPVAAESVVAEPEVLAFPDTDAPVLTEPVTPVVAVPEVPVVAEPEMPVEPFTEGFMLPLTEVEPFTPGLTLPLTEAEPLTPGVTLPFTEVEPFTPVPTEPEALPDVAAVPLFQEEPVDIDPFTEPDALAFMPELLVPLFHRLKFILVLEPGIAVNTQSPEKSSFNIPPLTEPFLLLFPVE